MNETGFFELMFDNIPFGVYILDAKGTMIYMNSSYLDNIGKTKAELLYSNVRDFVKRKEIDYCISDIVFREKRRIAMFQSAEIVSGINKRTYQQLVVSTPVFDSQGNIANIIAICIPFNTLLSYYNQANNEGFNMDVMLKETEQSSTTTVIAESEQMKYLLKMVEQVAKTDTTVLISGDSGTGKEIIAQYIHNHSKRANENLVVINCASLPENLLEAELFGYEKGAFTGAAPGGKKGLMEEAEGGTLFLDEINSMPVALQGKLLRALETKTIQRVGATKDRKIDFRLLSATNENLWDAVNNKTFRLDLYYRLNVIPVNIPSLKERRDDIIPLAEFFLGIYNTKYDKKKNFSDHTKEVMLDYNWPGNVRELKNYVERAVVMSADDVIEIPDIHLMQTFGSSMSFLENELINAQIFNTEFRQPEEKTDSKLDEGFDDSLSLQEYVEQCEREYVKHALESTKSTYEAAQLLKTSQSAIMRKKKKYNL